jgi:HK97 family phage portal protein
MLQRIRNYFGPIPEIDIEQKAYLDDGMMVTASYQTATWSSTDYSALVSEGFLKNSAVSACVAALAFAFPEPPMIVSNAADADLNNHPLQQLIRRPNPQCGEAELMQIIANYLAIGGNCYLYKARAGGRVKELWPFSSGQMWSEAPAGIGDVIKWYLYRKPNGTTERIPAADIVHLKWPVIDPYAPYLGLSPMIGVLREIDTDNELTTYLKAVIQNDAAPRTVLAFPDGTILTPQDQELLAAQFGIRHGGDRRGGVSIVTGGAEITRMAMNLQELTFDTLRAVPESRIAAAYRTPPIIAGLTVGLEHATYSNIEQASKDYTNRLLVPLWRMTAGELEADLVPEFGVAGSLMIAHDFTRVAAMQESADAKYTRATLGYEKGIMWLNEARDHIGLDPVPDGDTFKAATGATRPLAPGQVPSFIDVEPIPPRQLTDEAAKALYTLAVKEMKAQSTEPLEKRMQRVVQSYLAGQYEQWAAAGGEE